MALDYIASYADLIAAFGTNPESGRQHYQQFGATEGRAIRFDPLAYIASYGDLIHAFGTNARSGAEHYITYGHAEGRTATFDALKYIASYGDLIKAFGTNVTSAEQHYITYGFAEGRTATFDALKYIASYGDLIKAFGTNAVSAEQHYIAYGFAEGRTATFDAVAYLLTQPDLQAAGLGASGALQHWIAYGYGEGRSGDSLFGHDQATHDLTIGTAANAAIETTGDHDWFQVHLTAGETVNVQLAMSGNQGNVTLYDETGHALAFDAAFANGPSTLFTAPAGGTYYLAVSAAAATGTYSLQLNDYYTHMSGTLGDDVLSGTASNDWIEGLAGQDTLTASGGNDRLEGGAGFDHLSGGPGDDILYGNNARNIGLDGNDYLTDESGGNDRLFGQDGDDVVSARRDYGAAPSTILLDGGSGNDSISFQSVAASTKVTILGGDGNDSLYIQGASESVIDMGAGNDHIQIHGVYDAPMMITLGPGSDIIELTYDYSNLPIEITDFQHGQDQLVIDDVIYFYAAGWNGVDNLFADGYLKLVQQGADTLLQFDDNGKAANVYGGPSTLFKFDNLLASTLDLKDLGFAPDGSAAGLTLTGTAASDTLTGTSQSDIIQGGAGDDVFYGHGGNDLIEGGTGSDRMYGGYGDDKLYGNNQANSGTDTSSDSLYDYDGGSDQLYGQDGNDYLFVQRVGFSNIGPGTILMDGGSGNDVIQFNASQRFVDTVTIYGGTGDDNISTVGVYASTIDAGQGDDTVKIFANGATQTITLGGGSDILKLQASSDSYVADNLIHVTDFAPGSDSLDLQQLLGNVLIGWNPSSDPFAGGFLKLFQSGSDTALMIDRDGSAASNYSLTKLLTLDNVTASSLTAHDIVYAPSSTADVSDHATTVFVESVATATIPMEIAPIEDDWHHIF